MKRKHLIFSLFILFLFITYTFINQDYEKTAPTLYTNAQFITLEEDLNAQAMFVKDGVIEDIGSLEALEKYKKGDIQVIDLNGRTVLPGFIDPHTHLSITSFLANMVDLSGFKHETPQEVWNHFEKEVQSRSAGDWVICKGIDPILVEGLQSPTITYLDSVAPNNPVVMFSQSLHTYWANSKAFEAVGITNQTPDPSSASFYEKDSLGKLTGKIVEQKAMLPLFSHLKTQVLTPQILMDLTIQCLQDYAKQGNTTIVSAGLTITDAKPLRLYEHLSAANPSFLNQLLAFVGILPPRKPYPRNFAYLRHDFPELMPKSNDRTDDGYAILGIKHWYDGSPYTGSMYMNDPYIISELSKAELHTKEGDRGKALIAKDDLKSFIKKYQSQGWQIAVHTQGDAAISETIQAFEEVHQEQPTTDYRHRLEHCLLLPDTDIDRMKKLNMTPSFHINHIYYYGKALHESILGPERASKILPVASVHEKSLPYSLHADQPMFESKPFHLIQTAVERQTKQGDTLGYDQRIPVLDAIKSLTLHAAWQIHMENKLGSLKKGKYADFIVLDKNPLIIPEHELATIKVLQTFVSGNEIK